MCGCNLFIWPRGRNETTGKTAKQMPSAADSVAVAGTALHQQHWGHPTDSSVFLWKLVYCCMHYNRPCKSQSVVVRTRAVQVVETGSNAGRTDRRHTNSREQVWTFRFTFFLLLLLIEYDQLYVLCCAGCVHWYSILFDVFQFSSRSAFGLASVFSSLDSWSTLIHKTARTTLRLRRS